MQRLAALAALLALACKGGPPAPAAPEPGEAPPPAVVAPAGSTAFVSAASILRRQPTDAPRVKGPSGKEQSNLIATLQRGEKVVVVEEEAKLVGNDEWAHVKSSDDRDGWLKRSALIEGDGVTEGTVLVPADVFDRPDLLAANARRKIEPGTLLLVVRARPPFSEVNVSSGPNAWVLTDRIASADADVSVAKLTEKARWLKRNGKTDEALAILELARSTFPGQPLVEMLAAELAPPPGGEIVPVSAEQTDGARWESGGR
jgi:hypothetical protein